jgi:hypothetical protein
MHPTSDRQFRITYTAGTGASLTPVNAGTWVAARLRPRRRPPVASAPPLGRQAAVGQAFAAIRSGVPVEFHGPCGSGVTTLLRHLVDSVNGHGRPAAYLRAGPHDTADDILRQLVSELYMNADADAGVLARPDLTALIGRLRPLIALDDVDLPAREIADLVDALTGCALVLGGTRPVLGPSGESHALPGLTEVTAVDLIERDLGRQVAYDEHIALRRLITAVGGRPSALRRAVAMARLGETSFATLADEAELDPHAAERCAARHLGDNERRAIAVFALAAGVLLPAGLVGAICDLDQADQTLRDLCGRGLVDSHDDRFGVPICVAANYRDHVTTHLNLSYGARQLIAYLGSASTGGDPLSAASATLAFARYAAERAEWPLVVDLVRAGEPALLLAGRWGECVHLLKLGSHAAHAAGDWASEALFAHETGTIAGLRDEPQVARAELQHAARLRTRTGDPSGAAASAENLARVTGPAPAPAVASRAGRPGRKLWRFASIGLLVLTFVLLTVRAFGHESNPALPHATTTSGGSVVIGTPTPSGSPTVITPTRSPTRSPTPPGPNIAVTPRKLTFTEPGTKEFRIRSLADKELTVGVALIAHKMYVAPKEGCPQLKPGRDCMVKVSLIDTKPTEFAVDLVLTADGQKTVVPILVSVAVTDSSSSSPPSRDPIT